jgi:hypothetical protein
MTLDEINIAIAEHCGWTDVSMRLTEYSDRGIIAPMGTDPVSKWIDIRIPNYAGDLNAIHGAVNSLDQWRMADFPNELKGVILRQAGLNPSGFCGDFPFVQATAAQRAEAFLRTVNKWRD